MNTRLHQLMGAALIAIGLAASAHASTVQTIGAGSAVSSVDRSANFNTIVDGTDLSAYTENSLLIATPGSAYVSYDPFNGAGDASNFHYSSGGNNDWASISGTDSALMFGVEFLYGNGWSSGRPYGLDSATVDWEAYVGSVLVGSGSLSLPVGSVLGFSDASGFDLLKVRATNGSSYNAIALDDLKVQLSPGSNSVPDASNTLGLLALALGGLAVIRRKNA